METDDPNKKNDESINDPFAEKPSTEQENLSDLSETEEELLSQTENEMESDEESLEELNDATESEIETDEEILEESTEASEVDQSSYETPETEVEDDAKSEPPAKPMPKWLRNSLIFFGLGLVFLLAGYLIAYFTSTVPTQNSYQTTVNELQETKSQLEDQNSKFTQLNNDFNNLNDEFETLQSDYAGLEQEYNDLMQSSEFSKNLLSLKYEVANARYYLLKVDKISSRQAIILAIDYFDAIKDDLEPDISSGVEDRLQSIQKSITTKPDAALDELGTLFENLERIP